MKVKIENHTKKGHVTKLLIDGQEPKGTYRLKLVCDVNEVVVLEMSVYPESVVYEGEADVFVLVGEKRYRLIEEGAVQ